MTILQINYPLFSYWVAERESVRKKKEAGLPKPWSDDPVFQVTYFCNVRREDDKVTRFIRQMYSPHVHHGLFVHNIILSRFLNWPPTLEEVGYLEEWEPEEVRRACQYRKETDQKVWGNAYVVTTHGIKMDKIDYLCDRVMPSIENVLWKRPAWESCLSASQDLQCIEGISTFMAGQVVADLKNTKEFSLHDVSDWWTFVLPGPGSKRGMDWLCGSKVGINDWYIQLALLRQALYDDTGLNLHAQDIQNCLCEFDKFMRVKHGTGRSKRNYDGY